MDTKHPNPTHATPKDAAHIGDLLARSAFVLALGALIFALIPIPSLLNASMRDTSRALLTGAYGVILGALGLLLIGLWRIPPARLQPAAQRLARALQRPWLAVGLSILLIEGVLVSWVVLREVMPNIRVLLWMIGGWALLALLILAVANQHGLKTFFQRSQPLWISTGVTLSVLVLAGGLYLITTTALEASGIIGTLRGQTDPRRMVFFGGEENDDRSQAYWVELGQVSAQWLPYTYSRIEPLQGDYINVSASGLRQTANVIDEDQPASTVFFFGGSTVWGDGARDAYTIPSCTARALAEAGIAARVSNYGQYAYVSTQDLILFELQLALGNVPDVAVFYQGFNDLASAYMHDRAGLPHNEAHRVQEFAMGRRLDKGLPVLWRPHVRLDDIDLSLVATEGRTAAEIVALYLNNVRLVRAAAEAYGVRPLFVWQPALIFKTHHTPEEDEFLRRNQARWPEFDDLYRATDAELRRRVRAEGLTDIVILSDFFADEPGYIFFDRVHIIEDGNNAVARALLPDIIARLNVAEDE